MKTWQFIVFAVIGLAAVGLVAYHTMAKAVDPAAPGTPAPEPVK